MSDEATALTDPDLPALYRRYLDCLNRRALAGLGEFVDDDVRHNDRPLGLAGYREMLEVPWPEDRGGLVRHRQGGDRGAAVA